MWTNEALKAVLDVIKNGTHSMKRANKSWNIPMSSFTHHLNGKTKAKRCVYTRRRCNCDYMLSIQECGPSISLQQLKMKIAKITNARVTPFQNGISNNNWWYWFKCKHPKVNIW
jgi:hypothetical protein